MSKPIGVRLDKQTRTKIEKDAKKSGLALSTYACKVITDWTNYYKPILESGSIVFPIQLIKIFYNFLREGDHETVANLIVEYWHDSMNTSIKNPKYKDYLENLELWMNVTNQKLSILGENPSKHVITHNWGYPYSKITNAVLKKSWESLGLKVEEIEVKQNMFSYNLYEPTQD